MVCIEFNDTCVPPHNRTVQPCVPPHNRTVQPCVPPHNRTVQPCVPIYIAGLVSPSVTQFSVKEMINCVAVRIGRPDRC